MREPISRDSASPRELAEATKRLDRALEQLEAACAAKAGLAKAGLAKVGLAKAGLATGALDGDAYAAQQSERARLLADLDAARHREAALEAAALAASQALGRAADEVRAALGEHEMDDDAPSCDALSDGEDGSKPDGDGFNEEAA
jgi:hypothetical protein